MRRKSRSSTSAQKPTDQERILALKKELVLKRKRRVRFPLKPIISCTVFFLLAISANFYQKEILDFVEKVEISPMPSSSAQDKVEKKETKKNKTSKNKVRTGWTPEEISLFEGLEKRKLELDAREKQLNELQSELESQKKDLEEKLSRLNDIRGKISSELEEQIDMDEAKIKKLVEVYSGMKPQSAAIVFEEIDEDLAVKILGNMKKNNAANILNLLKPEKAKRLSEKYAGYSQ